MRTLMGEDSVNMTIMSTKGTLNNINAGKSTKTKILRFI